MIALPISGHALPAVFVAGLSAVLMAGGFG